MKYCIIEQDNDSANNLCFDIETEMDGLLAEMRERGIESLPVWYSPADEHSPDAYKLALTVNFDFESLVRARAEKDAQAFVSEFRCALDSAQTDWDSEAWGFAQADLKITRIGQELYDKLWTLYANTLASETERLVA